jgi:hypothetical protein
MIRLDRGGDGSEGRDDSGIVAFGRGRGEWIKGSERVGVWIGSEGVRRGRER